MYTIIVKTSVGTWTIHSTHPKKSDAQDQADMVHGIIVRVGQDGYPVDVDHCPVCNHDPMLCECDTPWSVI